MSERTLTRLAASGGLVLGLVVVGCLNRDLAPSDPHTQSGVYEEINQVGMTKVDLLFVVDNSNSMMDEQEILSRQIVLMVEELIHPTDRGPETPPPVEDLHIGIVTSDMGTHGHSVMTCQNPMNGDNGVLQNHDRGILEGCQATYGAADCDRGDCPWLSHSIEMPDDGSDPANPPIWDDFACIATLGTGGCGFEQQLESALVALTSQADDERPNHGFLRDDSVLAVIFVTDEDDCSTGNSEMFNTSRDDFGPPNTRCAFNPAQLYDIDRYYEGLISLRSHLDNPLNSIVVAAITGIPVDGSWNPGDPIEDLAALVQVNPTNPNELVPSCTTDNGLAYPPVRIVDLVYRFGNNGVLASICQSDWSAALEAITNKIQPMLIGRCMRRQLASTDSDVCRVVETLATDVACPALADQQDGTRTGGWHLDLGLDEDGRRQCEILPADYDGDACPDGISREDCMAERFGPGTAALQGWFYQPSVDDERCPYGQVRFTDADITSDMSDIRFECLTALCPTRRQCAGAVADPALRCDPLDPSTCDGTCVRHASAEVCGRGEDGEPLICARCSPTLESTCSEIGSRCASDPGRREQNQCDVPLVQAGGCCAEGFHCEDIDGRDTCMPDRTTSCR
jgi:hypothetical protein